ncbi:flagellar hook-basal body complex protein FliE [Anoxybacillus flavithermus]|uniref:Flagellar hook-basal body complex protein FliE n=1 Tax=Anoxybacillus flavithermus TaxID=33934 RepID=A0A2G5RT39_9BACL|nr:MULTISPECIES: flagellar hook-basal body complex protein FliE [Anoxybacillus]KFZ43344.1 flagellar hook-basal body protein FliE [Anoxybacillus sp. KU2-6(11)]PIC06008.1 flagellar hook-basal body complex protein FliE [Anoxybacillus flavithermus]
MIDRIQRAALSPTVQPQAAKPAEVQRAFSQFLKEAIDEVNKQQIASDQLTTKLAKGENVDLHNVMIASQKASVSLQLAIEVRNKVIEAYQEVMRMQV